MLIERSYIRRKSLILHDEDGSEESMPLQDALSLLLWLQEHKDEIEAALQEPEAKANALANLSCLHLLM